MSRLIGLATIIAIVPLTGISVGQTEHLSAPVASHSSNDLRDALLARRSLTLGAFQDEQPARADDWRVHFNSWIWALGIEGDVGVFGLTKSIDASFLDIVDESDTLFAFSGRLEFGKGRVGGFVDGLYTKLGVDDVEIERPDIDIDVDLDFDIDLGDGPFNPNPNPNPNPKLDLGLLPAEVDITLELAIVDFGVTYRLGEWPLGDGAANDRHVTLDAYAGARYTMLEIEIDPENRPANQRDRDWIDPIIGLRTNVDIAEDWALLAWGDVGGFGVSSDLTWSVTAVLGYDFRIFEMPATVYGGYRAIGYDYSDGQGSDKVTWDVTLHGPILGFSLRF